MNKLKFYLLIFLFFHFLFSQIPTLETGSQKPMPKEWIDKDTGHRVIRITELDGNYRSFYFHNNPFIPPKDNQGYKMVITGSRDIDKETDNMYRRRLIQYFIVDLNTFEIEPLNEKPQPIFGEIVGKKGRNVFYQKRDSIFAINIDTKEKELIFVFPDSIRGSISTINADETLLAGTYSDPRKYEILRQNPRKGDYFTRIFEAKIPHTLFVIDIKTGKLRKILTEKAWINHVQFSPTDPNLIMFCHEGPWHLLDRIWLIDIREGKPKLMHKRTVEMEIAGHEFFGPDGGWIWYDLQIPRGKTFYVAGVNIKTGERIKYRLKRDEWSVHYTISPDKKLFAGDGGAPNMVARAKNGKWIYLFYPRGNKFKSEKLVNMKHHNYDLEPNVHFTPDMKYIIFRANFEGKSQVYAVEIKKYKQ